MGNSILLDTQCAGLSSVDTIARSSLGSLTCSPAHPVYQCHVVFFDEFTDLMISSLLLNRFFFPTPEMKARDQAVPKRHRNQESVKWLSKYCMIQLLNFGSNIVILQHFRRIKLTLLGVLRPPSLIATRASRASEMDVKGLCSLGFREAAG